MDSGFETHYFLGSNSPTGFFSLYDNFTDPSNDILYIIKGFPGCGKSGFMRKIAEHIKSSGLRVEYIYCSGDPESLDGVYFPEINTGFVDGTSPHIIEPRVPGASEQYINLGVYCDTEAMRVKKSEIARVTHEYKALYDQSYDLISAADSVSKSISPKIAKSAFPTIIKRTRGIISRELKKTGRNPGKISYRFLSAFTHLGRIYRFDTISSLADRVFVFDNDFGLSYIAMETLSEAAADLGYDVINCMSPMMPDMTEHVIIPELRLAFISQTSQNRYPGKPARHIRLDAIPDKLQLKSELTDLRIRRKLAENLYLEAKKTLSQAKKLHDRLEEIYNPYVDFVAIGNLAKQYADSLLFEYEKKSRS